MPKLEQGDIASVEKLKDINIPKLAALAREGYAIVTPVPSCTLMFKQEIPLLFPEEEDVRLVRDAMFDPFEYFMARRRDGLLKTEFPRPLGKVAYHVPCHSRVQKIGLKTKEALECVPGTEVLTIERCSGHAGTYGVKKEFHGAALKIGRPVFRQVAEFAPDYFSSDCEMAGHHIEEGVAAIAEKTNEPKLAHPITLFRMAYGLPD
jgi:Fe-S oxidoreductase